MKLLKLSLALLVTLTLCSPLQAYGVGEHIRMVGSSTVFPFAITAAEEFGKTTSFRTPIVEATGTGTGFKLFCQGVGDAYPDMVNASRPIKPSEQDFCALHGVYEITELKLGLDGIVLAHDKHMDSFNLTPTLLFLALAQLVPQDGLWVPNPYHYWDDVDPHLPHQRILVYGPPTTSGTRDAFTELVMEPGCKQYTASSGMLVDGGQCVMLREDGHFLETGENDNIVVQKLTTNTEAIGIFGFAYLVQNADTIIGLPINGVTPSEQAIKDHRYPLARMLYTYLKRDHLEHVPGLKAFFEELHSSRAIGDDGYMILKGLIARSHAKQRGAIKEINLKDHK